MTMDNRSFYFQTIARKFFELRGAPFFLSSKELTLIEKWEKAGIPLRVVLEGLKKAYSVRRPKSGSRRKIMSLAFCEPQVKEAFAMYKERTVGGRRKETMKHDRREDIMSAVQEFIEEGLLEVSWLRVHYERVKEMLPRCSEEDLEQVEEEVETLLADRAFPEEKRQARKAVAAEFPDVSREEYERIFRIKLIKIMRDKYRIPHVAPFYY